jgi:hypothetical protein
MNERIQQLLKESTYNVLGVKQVDQKKFAELIVQECADIADRRPNVLINQTVGGWIKQHFGVEE